LTEYANGVYLNVARGFEWDRDKDAANVAKHGVSFEEATQLFVSGVDYLEIWDEEHSVDEDRFIAIGPIARGVVVVVFTERVDDVLRLISARAATNQELDLFQEWVRRESWRTIGPN
jgi:uncharacterized DUF497 family protein